MLRACRAGRVAAILAVSLVLVALASLVAAPAASAADPVESSIVAGWQAGEYTWLEARLIRATWRESARARSRLNSSGDGGRASVISDSRRIVAGMAAHGTLSPQRVEPALLSVEATTYVMEHRPFPAHEDVLHMPGEVVSFKYYTGRGVQFQPFETFKDGFARATWMLDTAGARAIGDRMLELSVNRRGMRTWEYDFPFEGNVVPWTSSISQAIATDFYQRLANSAEDDPALQGRYARTAASLLDLFTTSPARGGVAVPQGNGRFYLLYSHHPTQRVLNGHLQVLLSLHHYHESTGSERARFIINQGITAITPMMPRYDTGAWSNYQLGQEADLGYHELHVTQLTRLGRRTELPVFQDYAHRFSEYRFSPPNVTMPSQTWLAIVPPADGLRDSVKIVYRVSKQSREVVRIKDRSGRTVRHLYDSGPTGRHAVVWDGRKDSGRFAGDGDYTVWITATDILGNARTGQLTKPITVRRDRDAPTLTGLAFRRISATQTRLVVNAFDTGSPWVLVRVQVGGRIVAREVGPRSGSTVLRVPRPVARMHGAVVLLSDSSGNVRRRTID